MKVYGINLKHGEDESGRSGDVVAISTERDGRDEEENQRVAKKNEQEIQALRKENEEMKKKLAEGGPSAGPTNVVGMSYTSPTNPRSVEETKDKAPTHEMDGESYLNNSARMTIMLD